MPLKAYVGLPRAGKSYEVVVNVILASLRQGRRVVSNIAGLNYEKFCELLYQEGFSQEQIGELVCVEHKALDDPLFWRTDSDNETGIESFIQPGDLVALDEIWRFWKKRGDIHPRAMNFMRMHGHMTHPTTGLTCEIALITQSIRDINENIRDVVAETFQMVKNTKLGSNKSYIVHVFQRGSTSKSDFIRTLSPRFYKPEFFPLYKSHSQHKSGDADASEKNPDDRGNILKGAIFKIGIPLAIVFMASGFYFLWKFFHPASPVAQAQISASSSSAVVPINPYAPVAPPAPAAPEVSWRVIGFYQHDSSIVATLKNSDGVIRLIVDPMDYKINAAGLVLRLPEGGYATPWTAFVSKDAGLIK